MDKAVFFDMDGTLVDSADGVHTISARVKGALRLLQDKGFYVFVATGRPSAFLDEEINSRHC